MSIDAIKNFENRVWQVFRAMGDGRRCSVVALSHGRTISLGDFWYEPIRVVAKLIERGLVEEDTEAVIKQPAISKSLFRLTGDGRLFYERLCDLSLEEGGRAFVGRFHPYLH